MDALHCGLGGRRGCILQGQLVGGSAFQQVIQEVL